MSWQHVSPWVAGLRSRCPRCGQGALFDGYIALHKQCPVCGLDFSFADSGDGPAFFIMTITGFIVTGGALLLEVLSSPPYWVHAAIWLPLGIAIPLLVLRPSKATMVALQYDRKAGLGHLDG